MYLSNYATYLTGSLAGSLANLFVCLFVYLFVCLRTGTRKRSKWLVPQLGCPGAARCLLYRVRVGRFPVGPAPPRPGAVRCGRPGACHWPLISNWHSFHYSNQGHCNTHPDWMVCAHFWRQMASSTSPCNLETFAIDVERGRDARRR